MRFSTRLGSDLPLFITSMIAGLQIQINALSAIIPESFIFVLDVTDRSFIYQSSECPSAVNKILAVDKQMGMDTLFDTSEYFNLEKDDHFYMIRKLSDHTFMGLLAEKCNFSDLRLRNAHEYFLKMA